MGDRSLVQTTPATMRGGVLEPVDRDNCMPLQAVIVRNGKIFVDAIDCMDDGGGGVNDENRRLDAELDVVTDDLDCGVVDDDEDDVVRDENRRLEEEIDRLTGGGGDEDDDDEYMDGGKFSQEAFDSFMRATDDNEDDLGDIMIYNQLANGKDDSGGGGVTSGRQAVQRRGQLNHVHQFEQYDYHPLQHYHDNNNAPDASDAHGGGGGPIYNGNFVFHEEGTGNISDLSSVYLRHGTPVSLMYDVRNISAYDAAAATGAHEPGVDGAADPGRCNKGSCRRRDSLNLDEYSTFDEDIERLLSEDLDSARRYVPLYPENYFSSTKITLQTSLCRHLKSSTKITLQTSLCRHLKSSTKITKQTSFLFVTCLSSNTRGRGELSLDEKFEGPLVADRMRFSC
ncbi:hypothetical protein Btru_062705 [Bulinus truncatus]|nr:hypothetical protein Btru_062705 [Bulinus truncatus]